MPQWFCDYDKCSEWLDLNCETLKNPIIKSFPD